MSVLSVNTQPLVPRGKPYPPGVGSAAEAVLQPGGLSAGHAAGELAQALRNIQARLDLLDKTLRQQSPVVDKIAVVDSTGKVIAALGDFIFQGVPATNYFSEIHAGDPLNTGDPSQALFNANTDGSVTIGQHGWLDVLDPYGADAAWIGTQFDVLPVSGATNNGAGLIRLTVTGHTLATGDVVQVRLVIGVTSATDGTSNANGTWTVTVIDANHFDLQNSVFVGTYTSGGTVDRLMHVTGAANNGSGVIRLTVTAHGYESGDRTNIQTVGGVPNATGQWTIIVITANTFDLVGSTFAGAYTSGGTSLRFFAGGLFQTIAIGPSFANYVLRAFADGSLKIKNATIVLSSVNGIITLDPSVPVFKELNLINGFQTRIENGVIFVEDTSGGGGAPLVQIDPNQIALTNDNGVDVGRMFLTGGNLNGSFLIRNDGAGSVSIANGAVSATGAVDASGGFKTGGIPGLTTNVPVGTSLSVSTVGNGVTGTPGAGQANMTVVTGVSLTLTVHQVLGGIITT